MAEISQPSAIGAVTPADAHGERQDRRGNKRREERWSSRPVADVAFVLGIPEKELTPKVQEALNGIMREFDALRDKHDRLTDQMAYLQDLADSHAFLPIRNRRVLLRELARIIGQAERNQMMNSFLYLHLVPYDDIRFKHGHAAAEAALGQVAEVLRQGIRASDVVGSLDGSDFGIILTLTHGDAALDKARALVRAVEDEPFMWNNDRIDLTLAWGLHVFGAGEEATGVLDAADRDLRRQQPVRDVHGPTDGQPA